jgi:hypothetical protein
MITINNVLDKDIITQLQGYDPVVQEYRAFFRAIRLEPGAGTG